MTEDRLKYVAAKIVRSQNSAQLKSLRDESGSGTGLKQLLDETFHVGDDVVIISRSDFDTLSDIYQEQLK